MDTTDKINVLLVDDQPAKLLSYEVMLAELGENLIKAQSAREALETLLKTDVAVVLIDVCMPELDGFELAAMIRDHPRFQQTAIIFVSAVHLTETDYLRGYRAGAVDYVPVPVVPDLLRAKVKVFGELYRKTQQLERLNSELEQRVAKRTAELQDSTARLIESERGRGLALAAGNMGSWEYHVAEDCWKWDSGHSRIFGRDPPEPFCGPARISQYFREADWNTLQSLIDAATPEKNTFQTETRIQRENGDTRYCVVSTAVTFDDHAQVVRLDGVTIDITDRKEAEIRQQLLAREVDHRARNTLAVVQSIVRLTKSNDIAAYTDTIEGRIRALAHAQELLSQSRWQGADIVRLVMEEIAPYRTGDAAQISISGPSVILPPDKAQAAALSLHELATNAAKYGALSQPTGHVAIRWSLDAGTLLLDWIESGGPGVEPPASEGFGTKIINASIGGQSRGSVAFDWRPDGLRCRLIIPCAPDEVRIAEPPQERRPRQRAHGAPDQILLVEDEALLSLLMRDLLTEMGFAVVGPFNSVKDALAAARTEPLAGAVLDVNLGGEFVYPLAEYLDTHEIPFVFVTGYAEDRIERRFDGVPVLQKPLTRELLERALDSVMAPRTRDLSLIA
jgi:two-component sensor histidine kinase/response regulator RpfG family c-di-GMP phosphodiesterase